MYLASHYRVLLRFAVHHRLIVGGVGNRSQASRAVESAAHRVPHQRPARLRQGQGISQTSLAALFSQVYVCYFWEIDFTAKFNVN
jgi:hypothetical protein